MAKVKAKSTLTIEETITLELSGIEAAALEEMTKYGIDSFLKGYKKQLGSHYIEPHEAGLRSLFETIDSNLPRELRRLKVYCEAIESAREQFDS